jgi:hypothetical protein
MRMKCFYLRFFGSSRLPKQIPIRETGKVALICDECVALQHRGIWPKLEGGGVLSAGNPRTNN